MLKHKSKQALKDWESRALSKNVRDFNFDQTSLFTDLTGLRVDHLCGRVVTSVWWTAWLPNLYDWIWKLQAMSASPESATAVDTRILEWTVGIKTYWNTNGI